MIYRQEGSRDWSRRSYQKLQPTVVLGNGIKVARLIGKPGLREAAFEDNVFVVIATEPKGEHFHVIIQRNRFLPDLSLLTTAIFCVVRRQEKRAKAFQTTI